MAAYAVLDARLDTGVQLAVLGDAGMSREQRRNFAVRYPSILKVKTDTNTNSAGFNATVFKAADGTVNLAIRGTSGVTDIYEDAATLAPYGAAFYQIVEMYNWWQQVSNSSGSAVSQFAILEDIPVEGAPAGSVYLHGFSTGVGRYGSFLVAAPTVQATGGELAQLLAAGAPLEVTGHSLGGHLAMAFGSLFASAEITAFNAPGFRNDAFSTNQAFFAALGGSVPSGANTSNVIGVNDATGSFSPIAGLWSRPGTALDIPIEDQLAGNEPLVNLPASLNHSQLLLVDSLAVYRLLGQLDPAITPASFRSVFDVAGSEIHATLERLVDHVAALLGDGGHSLPAGHDQRDALYGVLSRLQDPGLTPQFLALQGKVSVLSPGAIGLVDVRSSFSAFVSLLTLSPLVLDVQESAAADFENLHPELHSLWQGGADAISEQQLADRLLMYSTQTGMFRQDLEHGGRSAALKFTDLHNGLSFDGDARGYGVGELADPVPYDHLRARYVFGGQGDDEITALLASNNNDHLFGLNGDDVIDGLDGSDYIEGGAGNDQLAGGEQGDILHGNAGADVLRGGAGVDYLLGGGGSDAFVWNTGDGEDVIGDHDDGGDRIIVNGVDLATLQFERVAAASSFYLARENPDLMLHYDGDFLAVSAGSGPAAGGITVTQYSPATGADYGIVLQGYIPEAPPGVDYTVTQLGLGDNEVEPSAFFRQQSFQGGLDWSGIAIRFSADDVANYSGGSLHGTLGGAFEGGPVADYLSGDDSSNALHGLAGADRIEGGAGDDLLEGGAGSDQLSGGAGDDLLFGSVRAGLADGLATGSQHDQFYLGQISDVAADINLLDGGAGDDFVSGGGQTDYIDGGAGNNYLFGGAGQDRINGGRDRDIIYGDSALHYRYLEVSAGVASEQLEIAFADGADGPGQYDDVLVAGAGDDTLWGELGNDLLHGQDGNDNLVGDRLLDPEYYDAELPAYGSSTAELNLSLHGNDRLYGGAGSDLLLGLGGDDLLAGGRGSDSLVGGAGSDIYAFQPGDGLDFIEDSGDNHTLLFNDIEASELQVLFQGDQVLVGPARGEEGFYLARSEWSNVRIALGAPDALIERARLDTYYYDANGNPLLSIPGSSQVTEAERDALFTVDDSDPDRPIIRVSAGADAVAVEALTDGSGGATMRIINNVTQFTVELAARQLASGMNFLQLADGVIMSLAGFSGNIIGSDGADHIIGSAGADTMRGGYGADILEGRGGNDNLDGGPNADVLLGGAGDDSLYGGSQGNDTLEGGPGDDILNGGLGSDSYIFAPGDGRDQLRDSGGASFLVFGPGVDPATLVLNYTGTSDSRFRIDYGPGDTLVSSGAFSSHFIEGITVGGVETALVQRSDLTDGIFRDTRVNDVFEPGPGSDTIFANGWGDDAYRFFAGDGEDRLAIDDSTVPELMGEIRFAADVDLAAVSVDFRNADALIGYGSGDLITLDMDNIFSLRDNGISRFALVSEADPDWLPVIRAEESYGNFYGSFGADHIIGGNYIDTILPGYGDDIIEAGEGDDWIILDEAYMYRASPGTGHKQIFGEGGDDTVLARLHQGETFHYDRGDGNDLIQFNWSYEWRSPYQLILDVEGDTLTFVPSGQDTLAFGEGISLADLRFIRTGDSLHVLMLDGSGGIRMNEFFHAYDVDPSAWTGHVSDLIGADYFAVDSLLHPAVLTVLPKTPIAGLIFADGTNFDMVSVLENSLEISEATLLGTEGADLLQGGVGNDVIDALGGDDDIEDFGGINRIDAGPGDDRILVGGDNVIDPGSGNDLIDISSGSNTVRFGPGGGNDLAIVDVDAATLVLEMAAGVTAADIDVALTTTEWGDVPMISLGDSSNGGDSVTLAGLRYDPAVDARVADTGGGAMEVRFTDGAVIAGAELQRLARGTPGEVVVGSRHKDVLVGTAGDDTLKGGKGKDTMMAGAGNDVLVGGIGHDILSGEAGNDSYLFASGDGRDVIRNADPDSRSVDVLKFEGIDHDRLWLLRKHDDLLVRVADSGDQVRVGNWYGNEADQLDALYAGGHVLERNQVDQLVSAMAAFGRPGGEGDIVSQQVREELEPVLASVWQLAG
jgi:Ca2+-binding RTX toxin-like protein